MYVYIYIYIYVCVRVCIYIYIVCVCALIFFRRVQRVCGVYTFTPNVREMSDAAHALGQPQISRRTTYTHCIYIHTYSVYIHTVYTHTERARARERERDSAWIIHACRLTDGDDAGRRHRAHGRTNGRTDGRTDGRDVDGSDAFDDDARLGDAARDARGERRGTSSWVDDADDVASRRVDDDDTDDDADGGCGARGGWRRREG